MPHPVETTPPHIRLLLMYYKKDLIFLGVQGLICPSRDWDGAGTGLGLRLDWDGTGTIQD